MIAYVLDTNIVSYILQDDEVVSVKYDNGMSLGNIIILPAIALYEIR